MAYSYTRMDWINYHSILVDFIDYCIDFERLRYFMALYTIIYNWYLTLFGNELDGFSSTIMGQSINLKEWICHSGTIITIVVFAVFLLLCVRYLFRLFANCFVR